jgi:hypothetical protein
MNKTFASLAAGIVLAATTAACGNMVLPSAEDSKNPAPKLPTLNEFKVETLAKGYFLSPLYDGLYKVTIPKNLAGTQQDLQCIAVAENTGTDRSMATMSCNWELANKAPTPEAPRF